MVVFQDTNDFKDFNQMQAIWYNTPLFEDDFHILNDGNSSDGLLELVQPADHLFPLVLPILKSPFYPTSEETWKHFVNSDFLPVDLLFSVMEFIGLLYTEIPCPMTWSYYESSLSRALTLMLETVCRKKKSDETAKFFRHLKH